MRYSIILILLFGVTYDGVDYEGINQGIKTGACLDRIDQKPLPNIYHDPVCNGSVLQKNVSFNARFRLYIKVKAIPPDSSTVYNFGDINVLQFDGEGEQTCSVMPKFTLLYYWIR